MYLYMITNLINNKKYIGVTNNPQKRWENHKCNNDPTMVIAKAIKKYGKENFKFEILLSNIPIDKIDQYEQEYIKKYHTHVSEGKGYNVSWGGMGFKGVQQDTRGNNNSNSHLNEEEARYIKSHRNLPMYVLYDKFSDKLSYDAFKKIYWDKTYRNIRPTVAPYPKNAEFSGQFSSTGKLSLDEVISLRKRYANLEPWKQVYQEYKDKYPDPMTFWNIYNGNNYSLVMPEVFTEENKKVHTLIRSAKGESNGKAKLTWDEVNQMRYDFEHQIKTRKEIQEEYKDKVSSTSINSILGYRTWKKNYS